MAEPDKRTIEKNEAREKRFDEQQALKAKTPEKPALLDHAEMQRDQRLKDPQHNDPAKHNAEVRAAQDAENHEAALSRAQESKDLNGLRLSLRSSDNIASRRVKGPSRQELAEDENRKPLAETAEEGDLQPDHAEVEIPPGWMELNSSELRTLASKITTLKIASRGQAINVVEAEVTRRKG